MIMGSFGQFHSLDVTVCQQTPENLFFKPELRIQDLQINFVFHQKNFFSGSDETLKVAKKSMIQVLLVDFFCSSEEPPATNALVQLRVITSIKLLLLKRFYGANVPEVSQKHAHRYLFCIKCTFLSNVLIQLIS